MRAQGGTARHGAAAGRSASIRPRPNLVARRDPLSLQEYGRILGAAETIRWRHGAQEIPPATRGDYVGIVRTLATLGCHPRILARELDALLRDGPHLVPDPNGTVQARWRRPKTRKWCSLNIPADLGEWLRSYLSRPRTEPYSVRQIERILRQLGDSAGIPGLCPSTFRHTVGSRIFRALGPAAARDSLGVSAPTLDFYTSLTDDARRAEVAKLGLGLDPRRHDQGES